MISIRKRLKDTEASIKELTSEGNIERGNLIILNNESETKARSAVSSM
jgi:hypothetical protein